MSRLVANIAIEGANGSFDKQYSYLIPEDLACLAEPGCRVTVPFGKGNTKRLGMILSVSNGEISDKTKTILSVSDSNPVLSAEMIELCRWMKEHTFCTYFDAIHTMLPAGLNYRMAISYSANPQFAGISALGEQERELYDFLSASGETAVETLAKKFDDAHAIIDSLYDKEAIIKNSVAKRKLNDMFRKYVRLSESHDSVGLTKRQQEIVTLLEDVGSVSVKELQYFTGVSLSVIDNLQKKGVIEIFQKQEFRIPYRTSSSSDKKEIVLTKEQQAAYDGLYGKCFSEKGETALLYGVTGSGKTQVFLKLTDDVFASGKGIIIMVPEIALTPQMIRIFTDRYGNEVAVFHSAMSLGQRMDEYNRIKKGKAHIAIGTRSAVFAPMSNLGLIIIDEEQEHTYKSEKTPRYHARDIAKFRCAYNKCLLCLSSATPSFESFSLAQSGKYSLFSLRHRYGNAILPDVTLVDMKKELADGNSSNISRELAAAIGASLENKKQSIILLNRRGHNTYLSCGECGWVAQCPNCSISLTYHSANNQIMCHYCGYSQKLPQKCPECENEFLTYSGVGTQRLQQELNQLFPEAKILRLDADSTMTRDSYSTYLSSFANGEYDILLGTQMVAKGLDFPNVTVVGVVGADKSLNSDDYRSFERTFSLITQVIGRAGRADSVGRAILQTNDLQSNIISLAQTQDYDAFYAQEILSRKLMIYPPYCDLCQISVQSVIKENAKNAIQQIFSSIKEKIGADYNDVKIIILGPSEAAVPKIGGKYRFRMIIKCRNNQRFRDMIRECTSLKAKNDVSIGIDINPEVII